MSSLVKILIILALTVNLSACKSSSGADPENYPKTAEQRRDERAGNLTGEGGLLLFSGKKSGAASAAGIEVNAYLWRASLDVISFMPLISTDPFGGVILTDWYSFAGVADEKLKVNVMINSSTLRSDAIKVTVFKQLLKQGRWVDAEVDPQVARSLEDKILTQARALRNKAAK